MKTKLLYICVSCERDNYLEQTWISAWSARHENPTAVLTLLTDAETEARLVNHTQFRSLWNEIIVQQFSADMPNKERSRALKTNMRAFVTGDFLFIDSDTIVTDALDCVDTFEFPLGMVLDMHRTFSELPSKKALINRHKSLFASEIPPRIDYHNSGVIFAKDSDEVHRFFSDWHKNWQCALNTKGVVLDQPPLLQTDIDFGGFITTIDGAFNCQIITSLQFLSSAKIIHFFNTNWLNSTISPFFLNETYAAVKNANAIDADMQKKILCCKSDIAALSMPVPVDFLGIYGSSSFRVLRAVSEKPRLFCICNTLCAFVIHWAYCLFSFKKRNRR